MNIALRTFNFLKNDSDYVPWQAMARELSYLDLMLAYTPAYGMFQVGRFRPLSHHSSCGSLS